MGCNTIDIDAGGNHNLALLANNKVTGWGKNNFFQSDYGSLQTNVLGISAGGDQSYLILSSGIILSFFVTGASGYAPRIISINNLPPGLTLAGQLTPINNNEIFTTNQPTQVQVSLTGLSGVQGPLFKYYQQIISESYSYQNNINGYFATGNNNYFQTSKGFGLTGIKNIYAGSKYSLVLFENDRITGFGEDGYGETLFGKYNILTDVADIATKSYHTLVLFNDNKISGFGLDNFGQATNGNILTGISGFSAGLNHSIVLLKNQKITGFGDNSNQQTSGTTGFYDWNQTPVGQITGAIKISAGSYHNLALLNNQTITGWGSDLYGKITGGYNITGIINIAAGQDHSIALLANGKITGWGKNNFGQVSGTISSSSSWENSPVGLLTGVVDISSSFNHNLALLANGKVTGWGLNSDKQVFQLNSYPYLSGVRKISAGLNNSLFILNDILVAENFTNTDIPLQVTGNLTGFGIIGLQNVVTGYTTQFIFTPKISGFTQDYKFYEYNIIGTPTLPGVYNTYILIDELGGIESRFAERYITFIIPNDKRFPMLYKVCGGATLGFIDKRLT